MFSNQIKTSYVINQVNRQKFKLAFTYSISVTMSTGLKERICNQ